LQYRKKSLCISSAFSFGEKSGISLIQETITVFKEFIKVRQDHHGFRRLFTAPGCDLYLWYNSQADKTLTGFQLVYNLDEDQKALTWTADAGFNHLGIDMERRRQHLQTPILVEDGLFEYGTIELQLKLSYAEASDDDLKFALEKIIRYGENNEL
jgi:hypothetical protein